jgi:membrane protease subunit HflK
VGPVRTIPVGHAGAEEEQGGGGPENVLWAVQHEANEFTLLLGDGRDLITIDAAVHYRIVDPGAWRYHTTNPEGALAALAYRAVMRNTVNKTLSDALSENVVVLTGTMREMVQEEADAIALGVEIVDFTVRAMHPPVAVARSYQAVVSAQIGRVTSVVNAQVFQNRTVPSAQTDVLTGTSSARGDAAVELARAAGEAWSFRTLEAEYRASPANFLFRRRLEALERDLGNRQFTILDARFQRDGGEVWVTP